MIIRPQPWGWIYYDADSDEFWVERQPGQNEPRLDHLLSVSCHLAGASSPGAHRQLSASLIKDWLYHLDCLQDARAMRLHLVGAEKIPRTDAVRIVRAGMSRGFGMVLSLTDCGHELKRFPGFPNAIVLRVTVDINRILGLQRKGGPSLASRINRLRNCVAAGLRVRVLSPYQPSAPVLLTELGEALALAGVRHWHILPPKARLGRESWHAAALQEVRALREHFPWMEIRYGNPMEREQELYIDVHGRVTVVESLEPHRVLSGGIEELATGDLLTEEFLARHAELWVSCPPSGEGNAVSAVPHVFLSYNHDDKELAVSLRDNLKASRVTTWMDESELLGGDLWRKRIEKALDQCPIVVACIGPFGIGDFQDLEITVATERALAGKGRLLPVLLPGAADSSIPSLLRSFQYVDLRPPGKEPLRRLLQAIQGHPPAALGTSFGRERPREPFRSEHSEGDAAAV
ncbi:MAG TPA: toll/interleukin-1 receptor domain-containing protein [Thermoanaerobaculia bacterium]|nr:toll/interleukin-1 receptor domain-containing protein [Thermoanaerobaculia bacterium]